MQCLVLIVEDNKTNQLLFQSIMGKAGYKTILAPDGVCGLNKYRINHPDIIISDIELPGMDGFEFAKSIRDEEIIKGGGKTPIIAVTGYDTEDNTIKTKNCGLFDLILYKPIDVSKLLQAIQNFVTKK